MEGLGEAKVPSARLGLVWPGCALGGGSCTMLLLEELGKCPFVEKGSTGEYLVYIVMINLVKLSSC